MLHNGVSEWAINTLRDFPATNLPPYSLQARRSYIDAIPRAVLMRAEVQISQQSARVGEMVSVHFVIPGDHNEADYVQPYYQAIASAVARSQHPLWHLPAAAVWRVRPRTSARIHLAGTKLATRAWRAGQGQDALDLRPRYGTYMTVPKGKARIGPRPPPCTSAGSQSNGRAIFGQKTLRLERCALPGAPIGWLWSP